VSEGEQGTAVEQPVAPAEQGGEGTAPSQEQSGEAGNVETPQEGRQPERGIPPSAYRELKGLRQRVREYERRFAELESRMQQPTAANAQDGPKSIWDDPDAYLESKFQTLQQQSRIRAQQDEAYKFIQSQDDVRTVEDEDEIAEVMRDNGLTVMLSHAPTKAVEIALKLWRESKGINPGAEAAKNLALTKNQAKAVVGAPAAGGKKIWTQAEIAQLSSDPVKWGEVRDEIVAAQKEGRIR
jgi:hypothetical protein